MSGWTARNVTGLAACGDVRSGLCFWGVSYKLRGTSPPIPPSLSLSALSLSLSLSPSVCVSLSLSPPPPSPHPPPLSACNTSVRGEAPRTTSGTSQWRRLFQTGGSTPRSYTATWNRTSADTCCSSRANSATERDSICLFRYRLFYSFCSGNLIATHFTGVSTRQRFQLQSCGIRV